MRCRVPEEDLSALLDGELPAPEERALRDHLSGCPACRRSLGEMRRLSATLTAVDLEVPPSPEFVERVSLAAGRIVPRRKSARMLALPGALRGAALAAAVLLLVFGFSVTVLLNTLGPVGSPAADAVSAAPRTPIDEYRARAAALADTEAGEHLELARWCRGEGLAAQADREVLRAFAADPGNSEARTLAARLLPVWTEPPALPTVRLGDPEDPGPPLPPWNPPPVADPLTGDKLLASLGLVKIGDGWMSEEAYRILREHREREDLLARNQARKEALRQPLRAAPATGDAVGELKGHLASLAVGEEAGPPALTVYPLVSSKPAPDLAVLSVADALRAGALTITEDQASATLFAVNRSASSHVFLAAGDILVGGHQDRIVTRDTLIPPGDRRVRLSVLCCEEGRSTGLTNQFVESPGIAPSGIRALLLGARDQDSVWARIRENLGAFGAVNRTQALRSIYLQDATRTRVGNYLRNLLPLLDDSRVVGFVVVSHGRILGGEVFRGHAMLRALARRFLASYILEALLSPASGAGQTLTPENLEKLLRSIGDASFLPGRSGAEGSETEFEGGEKSFSGYVLGEKGLGGPVHASLYYAPDMGLPPRPGARTVAPGGAPVLPPDNRAGPGVGNGLDERLKDRREGMGIPPRQGPPGSERLPDPPRNTPPGAAPPRTPPRTPPKTPPDKDAPRVPDKGTIRDFRR